MIQETYLREKKLTESEKIFFISNEDNFFNVYNQIKEVDEGFKKDQILIEPESKNTAPALALAVKVLKEQVRIDPDETILVLPSDHYVGDEKSYIKILKEAAEKVGEKIGILGVSAKKAETGYGYIKKGKEREGFWDVLEFKEKPDEETASSYIESGDYLWNSGKYLFSANTFLGELKKHSPDIHRAMEGSVEDFISNFSDLPSISVDHAISEKSDKVVVFEGDFGWSDIGSFDSLLEVLPQKTGYSKKHIDIDSENVFVYSKSGRLVATSGVKDLIVVENNDSILVTKKGNSENVKKVVELLKEKKFAEADFDVVVQRPWGSYEVLIDSPTYKVKKIMVYPGAKLSLQSHEHRAEHWVVVKGQAGVLNGEEGFILEENESTYIPSRNKHRLENAGSTNLEIIEVQTGTYLGEDDIIRYDDIYNRAA